MTSPTTLSCNARREDTSLRALPLDLSGGLRWSAGLPTDSELIEETIPKVSDETGQLHRESYWIVLRDIDGH